MAKRTTNRFVDEVLMRRESFQEISERTAASMRAELLRIRRESEKIMRANLGPFVDDAGNLTSSGAARLAARRTVDDVNSVLARGLTGAESKLADARLSGFRRAALDAEFAVETGAGQTLEVATSTSQIFEEAAKQAASRPVLGVPSNRQLRGIARRTAQANKEIITGAVLNGESIGKTAEKLKKAGDLSNAAATRIARNNMNAVANDAHRAVYEANSDVFSGYKWDATFDNRTTAICARLHGTVWPLGSSPPGPPAHHNCRSVLVGVFKDPEVEEIAQEGRRRVRKYDRDGNEVGKELVSSNKRFDEWLRGQPPIVQADITGSPLKGRLFRQGKIGLRDVVGDDLQIRGDRDVVRRALAKSPADAGLRSLADDLGVRPVTQATIDAEDLRLSRKAAHDLGDDAGLVSTRGSVDSISEGEGRLLRNAESRVSKTKRRIKDLDLEIAAERDAVRRKQLQKKSTVLKEKQTKNVAERDRLRRLKAKPPGPVIPKPTAPPPEPPPPISGEPLPLTDTELEASKRRLRSVESTLSRNRKKIRTAEAVLNDPVRRAQHAKARRTLQDLEGRQGLLIGERDELKVRIRTRVSPVTAASKRRRVAQLKKTRDPVGDAARGSGPAELEAAELADIKKKLGVVDERKIVLQREEARLAGMRKRSRELQDQRWKLTASLKRNTPEFTKVQAELRSLRSSIERAKTEVILAKRRVKNAQRPLTSAWRARRARIAPDLGKPAPFGTGVGRLPRGQAGKNLDKALSKAREEMEALGLTLDNLQAEGADSFLDALRAANGRTRLNNDQLTTISKMRRSMRLAVNPPDKDTLDRWTKTMQEVLGTLDDGLTRNKLLQKIDWNAIGNKRASANILDNSITMGSTDESWKVAHEFAHHIEYRNKRVSGRVRTWLGRRTRGEVATPRYSGSPEVSKKDRFWHEYTGRVYDDGQMAEGFTMGFQTLFNSKDFQQILVKDFEHVELVWSLMRGY